MISTDLAQAEVAKAGASIDALLYEIPPAVDAGDALEARALNKDVAKEIHRQVSRVSLFTYFLLFANCLFCVFCGEVSCLTAA